MSKHEWAGRSLETLVGMLSSEDRATRYKARKSLVALGKPAIPTLARTLQKSRMDHVRREAVKTLDAISDSSAIPSLVKVLEDNANDVAWLAAEALRKFKRTAWPPLLREFVRSGSESVSFRQGTHHVLRNQKEDGFNDLLATLTKGLESKRVSESTTAAAYDILKRLKHNP